MIFTLFFLKVKMKKNQKINRNNKKLSKLNKQLIILFKRDQIRHKYKRKNKKFILILIN